MTEWRSNASALLLAILMVTSVVVGSVTLLSGTSQAQAAEPLENAPPGTIFNEVLRGGDAANVDSVGLIKRGQSGAGLYNPSTPSVTLNPGDVVVARDGTQYAVNAAQTIPGSGGVVGPGATIYQGEQDTSFVGFQSDTLVGVPDQGAEGETLDINQTIPEDQETGVYQDPNTGAQIVIQEPRISRLEIINENGERINEGGQVREDEFVIVRADVNFLAAERAELTLTDPATGAKVVDGVITREEAINRFPDDADFIRNFVPEGQATPQGPDGTSRSIENPGTGARDTVYLIQDLSAVGKAGPYNYEVSGDNSQPFGDFFDTGISRVRGFNLVSAERPVISFMEDNRTATQGEFVTYQVDRSSAGNFHVVSLSADDLRTRPSGTVSISDITPVFRQYSDGGFQRGVLLDDGRIILEDGRVYRDGQLVTSNGTTSVPGADIAQVFTLIQVSRGGTGVNQLDSGRLDDTSVDIDLFDDFSTELEALTDYEQNDGENEIEQITLRVRRATAGLSLRVPDDTYVAGDDVDVEGNADPAVDFVSVYARDQGDWELISPSLERISVGSDGTWDEPNVVLSDESRVLRVPGNYRIGIVDFEDADLDGDGQADETLTSSEFSQGTSYQRGIRVVGQGLDSNLYSYSGQIAVEDGTVAINGTAAGADSVVAVLMDDQGNVVAERLSVDDQDEFDNDDVPLGDATGDLSEGPIRVFVVSPARDGVFGASGSGPDTTQEFISYVDDLEERGLTQEQIVELIRSVTVDDDGSDDLLQEFDFQLTDADTTITDVYPEGIEEPGGIQQLEQGETAILHGTTNLRPDDNTIVIEVVEGPSAGDFDVTIAELWNNSGEWRATMPVPESAEPGTYTIRADDGEGTTSVTVEVVEQREAPTTTEPPTETTTEPPTETTTEMPTETTTEMPTETTTTTESDGTPGFTVVLTTLALVLGVSLLVARRYRR